MRRFNADFFKKIKRDKGLKNSDIIEMLKYKGEEITIDGVKSWTRTNNPADPSPGMIKVLADVLNVHISDLDNYIKHDIDNIIGEIQTMHDTIAIPIIQAGAGAEAFADTGDVEKVYIERRLLPSNIISKINEHTMMIRVVGNSMQPKINENDVLFIDMVHGREFVMADGIYLVRYGDTVQIKQVQFLGNGEINLISLNPDYPVYNPAKDGLDWEILGKPFMRWGVEYFAPLEITA